LAVILETENLERRYDLGEIAVQALAGVSFSVEKGQFVAIMGPSGSGKSTLLHLLGGLDLPTAGRVVIDGTDLSRLSEKDLTLFRRKATGFVFQFYNLLPTLNVSENVAMPFLVAGRNSQDDLDRIEDIITLFGLRGMEKRAVTQLSAGEQQRVAIARAFLTDPTIVIADEPTGNLDTNTGAEILQLLWESCDNYGQTILLVTHYPRVAVFADRVLVVRDGLLVDDLHLGRREDHYDVGPIVQRLQDLGL